MIRRAPWARLLAACTRSRGESFGRHVKLLRPNPGPIHAICQLPGWRGLARGPHSGGGGGHGRDAGGGDVDAEECEEEPMWEELEKDVEAFFVAGERREMDVMIVHPVVRERGVSPHEAEVLVSEAMALVGTLPGWAVRDCVLLRSRNPGSKFVFGKGNFKTLTDKVRASPRLSAVFVNMERLTVAQEICLEEAWGLPVLDRYSLVLRIFQLHARTREAKLQIALASIPLMRSRMRKEHKHLDQQGGGSRYLKGPGETALETQRRVLEQREQRLRRALGTVARKRSLLRSQRSRAELPVVALVGYTNSGKTTLARALTHDLSLEPHDAVFATLDVTAHAGLLPGRTTALYVDTVGFLSRLPHGLVHAFSATLEDVLHSDVIVHVRDISNTDTERQRDTVLHVLAQLGLSEAARSRILEVHNKIDLMPQELSAGVGVQVSALHEWGLEELKERVQEAVLIATNKAVMELSIPLEGEHLAWLYREAAVQDVRVIPESSTAHVSVIISQAALGKFYKRFGRSS
ncbi:putative GTP-binding protein 6 isoform X3 [Petromyzon marinus]|uniref:putative GTP-binding protein 6 isoform X3 n=1 Tax=Petromyzon marinus TaxID=7757 RepID=UPI003F6EBB7C